jgi:hypothetical protein
VILLYQGQSTISRLIRFFNWSPYSHASWTFAQVADGVLRGDRSEFEAWMKGGVCHREHWGEAHTTGTRVDCYELEQPLSREEQEAMMLFLAGQLGKRYDMRGVFHFLSRSKSNNPDRWFCSELIFAALRKSGRRILEQIADCQVYPGMLAYSPEVRYVGYLAVGEGDRVHE